MPLQRHPSLLSGSIWSFHYFFTYIFYHCFHLYFSHQYYSRVDFFLHFSAFSWLFLISLCHSLHIFCSALFFGITFVSSEQEFSKDLVCFFDSGAVQGPAFYSPLFPPRAVQYEVFECFPLLTVSHTYLPVSLPKFLSNI